MGLGDVLEVYQLNHETVVYTEVSAIFHPLMGLFLLSEFFPQIVEAVQDCQAS